MTDGAADGARLVALARRGSGRSGRRRYRRGRAGARWRHAGAATGRARSRGGAGRAGLAQTRCHVRAGARFGRRRDERRRGGRSVAAAAAPVAACSSPAGAALARGARRADGWAPRRRDGDGARAGWRRERSSCVARRARRPRCDGCAGDALSMSRGEAERERREEEGDPRLRAEQRRRQRALARDPLVDDVARARRDRSPPRAWPWARARRRRAARGGRRRRVLRAARLADVARRLGIAVRADDTLARRWPLCRRARGRRAPLRCRARRWHCCRAVRCAGLTPVRARDVRKAVIPAAGLGTRFLPATKAIPKEMLPIVDMPTIQLVVEEAVAAGHRGDRPRHRPRQGARSRITSTSRTSSRTRCASAARRELARAGGGASRRWCALVSVRQKEPLGLGHAVLWRARPSATSRSRCCSATTSRRDGAGRRSASSIDVYESRRRGGVIALMEVPAGQEHLYGVVAGERDADAAAPAVTRHGREAGARAPRRAAGDHRPLRAAAGDLADPRSDHARAGRRDPAHRRAATLAHAGGGLLRPARRRRRATTPATARLPAAPTSRYALEARRAAARCGCSR